MRTSDNSSTSVAAEIMKIPIKVIMPLLYPYSNGLFKVMTIIESFWESNYRLDLRPLSSSMVRSNSPGPCLLSIIEIFLVNNYRSGKLGLGWGSSVVDIMYQVMVD